MSAAMTTGKVFGVGWAKTGTTTLGECMRLIGNRHVGGRLDLVDYWGTANLKPIYEVAREHDSAEDWPWLLMFHELDAWFPGSRFVLTTREPQSWLRSYRNMLDGQVSNEKLQRRRNSLYSFDVDAASNEQLLARVERHNTSVRNYFAARPTDLLEVDWASGDGWQKLCTFLDVPVPDAPFPHANKASYASSLVNAKRLGARARRLMRRNTES